MPLDKHSPAWKSSRWNGAPSHDYITHILQTSDYRFALSADPFRQSTFLRRIDLDGIIFDWDMFPFRNLTHLRLHTSYSTVEKPLYELCHLLARMTLLEDLSLNMFRVSSPDYRAMATTTAPFKLPHLEALLLRRATSSQICALLNGLTLPKLRRLDIMTHWASADHHTAKIAAAAISATLENGDFGKFDTLEISDANLAFYLYHADLQHQPEVTLTFSRTATTAQYLSGLSSASLTRVHISSPLHRDKLVQILGALPQLEALKISHKETITALPTALIDTANYVLGPPGLRSIACCSFDWQGDSFMVLTGLCNILSQRHSGCSR